MVNKAIDFFFARSIDKGMIKNLKELTMTFVRDVIVGNFFSVTHYHSWMVTEIMVYK